MGKNFIDGFMGVVGYVLKRLAILVIVLIAGLFLSTPIGVYASMFMGGFKHGYTWGDRAPITADQFIQRQIDRGHIHPERDREFLDELERQGMPIYRK